MELVNLERAPLPRRFVVSCKECHRVVMMPSEVGAAQLERLRWHLNLHLRHRSPQKPPPLFRRLHDELLLHYFRVRPIEGEGADGDAIGARPSPGGANPRAGAS
jgi:hypothetical protein